MKTNLFARLNLSAAFVAVALFMGGCSNNSVEDELAAANGQDAKGSPNQTAQSIMINVESSTSDYIIVGSEEYQFNDEAAAIAYHGYNSCTTNSCRNDARQAARAKRCDYWADGDNNDGFWVLKSSTAGETIHADYAVTMAAESFVKNKQFPTKGKYSFTLDGRISNLVYIVDGVVTELPYEITAGTDFEYNGNAFFSLTGMPLQNGSVFAILNSDDASSNNGLENAYKATGAFGADLGEGAHTITVQGTFKGNDGHTNSNFSVTKTVTVSAGNCAN